MSQKAPERTLTEEVAEFLARGPSAHEIANYRISESAQERVRVLMEKNEDGTLTAAETAELDEITVLDQLFTLIRARQVSQSQTDSENGH
ncbi:MAG TPA: hypothetical protein VF116_11560 [Ktedonobacterales bacterium]